MFGRATITFGIGPHSSWLDFDIVFPYNWPRLNLYTFQIPRKHIAFTFLTLDSVFSCYVGFMGTIVVSVPEELRFKWILNLHQKRPIT